MITLLHISISHPPARSDDREELDEELDWGLSKKLAGHLGTAGAKSNPEDPKANAQSRIREKRLQ